jgi:hypothetical protein
MLKSLLILGAVFVVGSGIGAAQATVHLEPVSLQGPRELQPQTSTAVIRDYMESWKGFSSAMEKNQADLLNANFVGTAKEKLSGTIEQQSKLGIHAVYQDRSHDLQIVFYSPEGLSIEMTDNVDYDVQVFDHDSLKTTQHVHAKYVVVLSPDEVRWRVRVFQAVSE